MIRQSGWLRLAAIVAALLWVAAGLPGVLGTSSGATNEPGRSLIDTATPCPTGTDCAYVIEVTHRGPFGEDAALVPIGLRRQKVGRRIALPGAARSLAVAPSGRTAYLITEGRLYVIDLRSGRASWGHAMPPQVAAFVLTPSGRRLYGTARGTRGTHFRIDAISVRTGKVQRSIPVVGGVQLCAISPDGQTLYVTIEEGTALVPVDVATGGVGPPIPVPKGAHDLAIAPGGQMAYAPGDSGEDVGGITYSFLTPIDLATGVAEAPIRLRHGPTSVALSPNGRTAMVTGGFAGPPIPPSVSLVNLKTHRVTSTIRLHGVATAIAAPFGG